MSEELQKVGLYIDDIFRLRVQDPRIAAETNALRDECLEYSKKLEEFRSLSTQFHKIVSSLAKDVEKEKIRAISAQNLLKTVAKQREAEQQAFQSKIHEKNVELDRLKTTYQYLHRIESEQQEMINNYVQN